MTNSKPKTKSKSKSKHDIVYDYDNDAYMSDMPGLKKTHTALLNRLNKYMSLLRASTKEYSMSTHVSSFEIGVEIMSPMSIGFRWVISEHGAYHVTVSVSHRTMSKDMYSELSEEVIATGSGIVTGASRAQATEFGRVMFDITQSVGSLQRQLDMDYKRELARLTRLPVTAPTQ